MQHGIHFISGLPRAGSTLLAGILRQNPRVHVGMTSPIGTLFAALLGQMSQSSEFEPSKIFGFDGAGTVYNRVDTLLGTPGLHCLAARVQRVERQMVLPPDIVRRVENDSFWRDSKRNLRGGRVV